MMKGLVTACLFVSGAIKHYRILLAGRYRGHGQNGLNDTMLQARRHQGAKRSSCKIPWGYGVVSIVQRPPFPVLPGPSSRAYANL